MFFFTPKTLIIIQSYFKQSHGITVLIIMIQKRCTMFILLFKFCLHWVNVFQVCLEEAWEAAVVVNSYQYGVNVSPASCFIWAYICHWQPSCLGSSPSTPGKLGTQATSQAQWETTVCNGTVWRKDMTSLSQRWYRKAWAHIVRKQLTGWRSFFFSRLSSVVQAILSEHQQPSSPWLTPCPHKDTEWPERVQGSTCAGWP